MVRRLAGLFVIATSLVSVTWGHPGHGTTDPQSVEHFTSEPLHLLAWGLAAASVAAVVWMTLRSRAARLESKDDC